MLSVINAKLTKDLVIKKGAEKQLLLWFLLFLNDKLFFLELRIFVLELINSSGSIH